MTKRELIQFMESYFFCPKKEGGNDKARVNSVHGRAGGVSQ